MPERKFHSRLVHAGQYHHLTILPKPLEGMKKGWNCTPTIENAHAARLTSEFLKILKRGKSGEVTVGEVTHYFPDLVNALDSSTLLYLWVSPTFSKGYIDDDTEEEVPPKKVSHNIRVFIATKSSVDKNREKIRQIRFEDIFKMCTPFDEISIEDAPKTWPEPKESLVLEFWLERDWEYRVSFDNQEALRVVEEKNLDIRDFLTFVVVRVDSKEGDRILAISDPAKIAEFFANKGIEWEG